MAAISFSTTRNGDAINSLTAGAQVVTEGTQAPSAGQLEIRLADGVPWTKRELKTALDNIWRFLQDPLNSTSIPL